MSINRAYLGNSIHSHNLMKRFISIALLSVIIICCGGIFGLFQMFSRYIIADAEKDAVEICQVLIEQQKHLLFKQGNDGRATISVNEKDLYALDQGLRRFLTFFDIIKIKIYDTEHRIVFSTESKLIGKRDEANKRLKKALMDQVDSKLETKERAHDLAEESIMDVDVVETYVPIKNEARTVVGCFEIYMNVTKYRVEVRKGVGIASAVLSAITILIFFISYTMVRRSVLHIRETELILDRQGIRDPLTGALHRVHFMEQGEGEFEKLKRVREKGAVAATLGCIIVDIDQLKAVNDAEGYQVGDQILTEMVERIYRQLRPNDMLGRFNGGEFMILLPDTTFEQSLLLAERIRESVCAAPCTTNAGKIPITVCLGVSCTGEEEKRLDELLKRTEEGLLKAKSIGRNRVAWIFHPSNSQMRGETSS